jgi:hypothetical protein
MQDVSLARAIQPKPEHRSAVLTKTFGVIAKLCVLLALLLWLWTPASAQRREVWGVVTDNSGQPVQGAAVKLSNRVTLKIRSFITQTDGKYRFRGLHPDIDYTVRALKDGQLSNTRRLSHLTSRKLVRADLRINTGK